MIVLSQQDPRWAARRLGDKGAHIESTIGRYGCAITCLAMLLDGLLGMYDPIRVQDELLIHKGYRDGNLVNWPALPGIYRSLGHRGRFDCPDRAASSWEMMQVSSRLRKSQAVILWVDARRDPSATPEFRAAPKFKQHFVIAHSIDRKGMWIINDPWHGDSVPVCPRYGRTIEQALCGAILFDVKATV